MKEKEPYIGMPIYLEDCGCGDMDDMQPDQTCMDSCFENWPLAMAYVPMQPWEKIYDPAEGLQAGTIFPSLDLPFLGGMKR